MTRLPVRADDAVPWEPIGFSQAGAPIAVHHLGAAPSRILILGGQHGGPEANTVELVQALHEHFAANRQELPDGLTMDVIPIANPDGMSAGMRQYLSGVDPNRNWGGPDWQADAFDSNAQFRTGLGGAEPFSEQETRALADYMLRTRPVLTVNYHSAGGFLFGSRDGRSGEIAAAYAAASGYPRPAPTPGSSPLPYRATGSLNVWARTVGLDALFIELSTPYAAEVERNLAGLRAVLPLLATQSALTPDD
ncbi:MAG: hypothetical protein IT305_14815 [Chloroflexi bacterium]|nr:hypothetical protein [Chloroflexota bacterium]